MSIHSVSRWKFRLAACAVGLVLGGAGAFVLHSHATGLNGGAGRPYDPKEDKPVLTQDQAVLPPIDRAAPAKTETATFAMG